MMSALLLGAGLGGGRTCLAQASSATSPAAQASAGVRTQFVAASREPLASPFLTVRNLPRTLSIDALTDSEVNGIRQEVFDEIQGKPAKRIEGIDGCMQWLFVRQAGQPWQPFGFALQGTGLVKLNGAMRPALFSYSIAAESVSGLSGISHVPGRKPGAGETSVHTFEPKSSFRDFRASMAADGERASRLQLGSLGTDARYLAFGRTDALAIARLEAPCTLLQARCRQYVFPVNRSAEWVGSITRNAANWDVDHVHETIGTAPGLTLEIAIEDMCPFSREALVEAAVNVRAGGAEPGVRKYGIKRNASLKEALRPHVQESKR